MRLTSSSASESELESDDDDDEDDDDDDDDSSRFFDFLLFFDFLPIKSSGEEMIEVICVDVVVCSMSIFSQIALKRCE